MNPKLFSEVLTRHASSSRLYYTNTANKATLYYKISPLGDPARSVAPELDEWVQKGKKVRVGELQRIIHDLRKRKRFSQALEVQIRARLFLFSTVLVCVMYCVWMLGKCKKQKNMPFLV